MRTGSIRSSESGVSEVIGALILVLVVVAAGSVFAVFVSERQERLLERERLNERRDLEGIDIIAINPTFSSGSMTYVEFTISNIHSDDSYVTKININDLSIRQCYYFNHSSGLFDIPISFLESFNLGSLEQRIFRVSLIASHNNFFSSPPSIRSGGYIKVDVFTELTNDFQRTFHSPSPIFVVRTDSEWDSSTASYINVILFDGSLSDQPIEDGEIIEWSWSIQTDHNPNNGVWGEVGEVNSTATGRMLRADDLFTAPAGTQYRLILTIKDNFGMVASDTHYYTN
jgi:flagellin-like protein